MTKKKILFLILAGLIFINVVLYFNGSLVASGTSTSTTWEPGYEITLIIPSILLVTFLIFKLCNKTLRIILAETITIVALSVIMFGVNADRISDEKAPLYLWKTSNENRITYYGVGYKVIAEGNKYERSTTTMYNIFNKEIHGVIYAPIEVYIEATEGDKSFWLGEYSYKETSELGINTLYEMEIYKEKDEYFATIDIRSEEVTESLQASVTGYEWGTTFSFIEYLKESADSKKYYEGDVLFGFDRKKSKVYTRWEMLKEDDPNIELGAPTVSFVKKQVETV